MNLSPAPAPGKIVTAIRICLILFGLQAPASAGAAEPASLDWPLKIRPQSVTGTFGEPRSAHLHTGLDIRTQGREGVPVYAPAEGAVTRVRCSPDGYGKAVYFRLDDGRTMVFAHLSGFADRIQDVVTRAQARTARYQQDIQIDAPIRLDRGELLAVSGATGVGAPHLHAEIRGVDGRPRNPLLHGLKLDDTVAPEILGIRLIPLAPSSRLGGRARSVELRHGERIEAEGPLGVRVRLRDRTQHANFGLMPAAAHLSVDGESSYELRFDVTDFGTPLGEILDTEADGELRWVQLFDRAALSGAADVAGVVRPPTAGSARLVVQTEDAAGNEARASFELSAPSGGLPRMEGLAFERLDDEVAFHLGEAVVELRASGDVALPEGAVAVAPGIWAVRVGDFAPWARQRAGWRGVAGGEDLTPEILAAWPLEIDPRALGPGGILELVERPAPAPFPDGCEPLGPAVELRALGIVFQSDLRLRWRSADPPAAGATVFHHDWRGRWQHAGVEEPRAGELRSEGTVAWMVDRKAPTMGSWVLEDGTPLEAGERVAARPERASEGRTLARWPSVVLGVFEDGSGIEASDIRASLDGRPFPARFDPEDGFVAFDFFVEPKPGVHELSVELRDRVGNPASSTLSIELGP